MIIKEIAELTEIAKRLDKLIDLFKINNSLLKIANQKTLSELRRKIKDDIILSKIYEYSNATKSYGDLAWIISDETGKAEITIKKKITELRSLGVISTVKKDREVVYEKTGVI